MLTRLASVFSALALAAAATFAQPPAADPSKPAPAPQPAKPDQPKTTPDAPKPPANPEAAKPAPASEKLVFVKMSTTAGDIIVELNNEKAPITVANFLSYVDKKFYEGTIFHRTIPTFMIQGGGFDKDFKQKPTEKPIKNEWQNGLKNVRGAIAMARTGVPDSATSQFFIDVKDNPALDGSNTNAGYAVFGKVIGGMDVVDKIKDAPAVPNEGGEKAKPVNPVVINSVTRMTAAEAAAATKSAAPAAPAAPATPETPKPPAGGAPAPKPSK